MEYVGRPLLDVLQECSTAEEQAALLGEAVDAVVTVLGTGVAIGDLKTDHLRVGDDHR